MTFVYRSKLVEVKSGYFSDSLGVGIKEPSGLLHVVGGDFIHQSGIAFFDHKPLVSGVPIMLSGEAESVDLSNYVQFQNIENLSGVLNSRIESVNEANNNLITGLSGSLQSQINNLNISANGASIVSDYQSGVSYVGRALVGSSESDPVWAIKKIQLTNSGTVSGSVLKSANSPWTGRYFLNYQ